MTEERIKCECCDELFTRSLYEKHWEHLSDDPSRAWRYIPLDQIIPNSRLLEELELVGYETAGDVLDAEPDDLAADVYGIGPKRAIKIRQQVFDYVRPQLLSDMDNWRMVPADIGKPVRRTTAADIISAACMVTVIGLMAYLVAWLVL